MRSLRNRRLCTFLRLDECLSLESFRTFFEDLSLVSEECFRRTLTRTQRVLLTRSGEGAGERDLDARGSGSDGCFRFQSPMTRNWNGSPFAFPEDDEATDATGTTEEGTGAGAGTTTEAGLGSGRALRGGGCGKEGTQLAGSTGCGGRSAAGILLLAELLNTRAADGLADEGLGAGESDLDRAGRFCTAGAGGPLDSGTTRTPGDELGLGWGTPKASALCSCARLWFAGSAALARTWAKETPAGVRDHLVLGAPPALEGTGVLISSTGRVSQCLRANCLPQAGPAAADEAEPALLGEGSATAAARRSPGRVKTSPAEFSMSYRATDPTSWSGVSVPSFRCFSTPARLLCSRLPPRGLPTFFGGSGSGLGGIDCLPRDST